MKKLLIILILIVASCTYFSGNFGIPGVNDTKESTTVGIKFAIRHHPGPNQECIGTFRNCPECSCPLGLCICLGIKKHRRGVALSQDEIDDKIGTGVASITDDEEYFNIIFDQDGFSRFNYFNR
jgi:hypothetical protein